MTEQLEPELSEESKGILKAALRLVQKAERLEESIRTGVLKPLSKEEIAQLKEALQLRELAAELFEEVQEGT